MIAPIQPAIASLLETDLYKFTMWQALLHQIQFAQQRDQESETEGAPVRPKMK